MNKEIDLTYLEDEHKPLGFCVGLHTLPNKFESSYHWHDYYEMEFIIEGSGTHIVNDKQYELKRGDVYIITTSDFHSLKFETNDAKSITICFFLRSLPPHITKKILHLGFSKVSLNDTQFKAMRYEFDFLLEQYTVLPDINENALLQNAFERVILMFLNFALLNEQPKNSEKHLMPLQKVLTFVQQNYSKQITLEEAAAVAAMSTTHFSRYFKQNMNVCFVPYLNKVRCSIAAAFLSSTDMPIEDIATRTGYITPSYFSKVFRDIYGQPPTEYRQQCKVK